MSSTIIGYNKEDIAISSMSKIKNEEWLIPIRRDGSILTHNWSDCRDKLDLSYEFEDQVRIKTINGNLCLSSLRYGNAQYLMFPTEFQDCVYGITIVNGVFSGRFKFRQRGPKIGVQYLGSI